MTDSTINALYSFTADDSADLCTEASILGAMFVRKLREAGSEPREVILAAACAIAKTLNESDLDEDDEIEALPDLMYLMLEGMESTAKTVDRLVDLLEEMDR